MNHLKDITGFRFTKLTVIRRVGLNPSGEATWFCNCDCGGTAIVSGTRLRRLITRSCGCIARLNGFKHGHSHIREGKPSRAYEAWSSMKARCFNPNKKHYKHYGGRGITVCHRWLKFENFLADMGECPPKHSLHRKNNDKNYEPSNCKWATAKEQARARSNNRILSINGESQPLIVWAERFKILKTTLRERLQRGWTVERAVGL